LLGALAFAELTAFERLATDSRFAPNLVDKQALAEMAVAEFSHFDQLRVHVRELGVTPEAAMEPFIRPLMSFHEATAPNDWYESLVKAYVGDGIAIDFYREIALHLPEPTRSIVLGVLRDTGHAAFAIERVRAGIEADPALAGRLALWARRLVGEALTQAQRVAVDRPGLAKLLGGAVNDLGEVARLLARITDAHSKRMHALGLSP
jgi:hypothetical protein